MKYVTCPACNSPTPPMRYCMTCNAALHGFPSEGAEGVAARVEKSRSKSPVDLGFKGKTSNTGTKGDPQLDRQIQRTCKQDVRKRPTSSSREKELTVIATVKAKRLKLLERLGHRILGDVTTIVDNADGTRLVTARIPTDPVRRFLWKMGSVNLNGARRIRPLLEDTVKEICASADQLRKGNLTNGGKGVIVGIVDFGIDFVHRNFRDKNGSTRILAIWDQKMAQDFGGPAKPIADVLRPKVPYGRVLLKKEINEALLHENPYDALGYEPPRDSAMGTGAHGTYVADVAAGNGRGTDAPGVAGKAGIVFVDLSTAGTPLEGPQTVGNTFGDSAQLLEAIKFIFDFADAKERPCVINLSLGTNGGPHDGTSPVELAIDRMVKEKPNRAVVIAAGNFKGKRIHAMGKVTRSKPVDLKWKIPLYDSTSNELEIWHPGVDRFTVELVPPQEQKPIAVVKPGKSWEKQDENWGLITVVNRVMKSNNDSNTIGIYFEGGVSHGDWTLRLRGDSVRDGRFHAWIERDDYGQSYFVKAPDDSYQVNDECTLSSIACGRHSIVVGSYDIHDHRKAAEYSSSGPTRDAQTKQRDFDKPEISAPGELVLAARSGTVVERHRQYGTSMAAPAVTGVVALMLAEAKERRIDLSADHIRRILVETALKEPPPKESVWHPQYGYGRVSACAALRVVGNQALGCDEPKAALWRKGA